MNGTSAHSTPTAERLDGKSFGQEQPSVARDLNDLAQLTVTRRRRGTAAVCGALHGGADSELAHRTGERAECGDDGGPCREVRGQRSEGDEFEPEMVEQIRVIKLVEGSLLRVEGEETARPEVTHYLYVVGVELRQAHDS